MRSVPAVPWHSRQGLLPSFDSYGSRLRVRIRICMPPPTLRCLFNLMLLHDIRRGHADIQVSARRDHATAHVQPSQTHKYAYTETVRMFYGW